MNYKLLNILPLTILVLCSLSLNAYETPKVIPEQFQGQWSSDLKYCNKDHEYNLKIFKDYLMFWESIGSALSIVTKENNELALILELSGEGEEWLSFKHYKINNDNNQLTDITDPYAKNKLIRYKCK